LFDFVFARKLFLDVFKQKLLKISLEFDACKVDLSPLQFSAKTSNLERVDPFNNVVRN
jgi:hypothetical protein